MPYCDSIASHFDRRAGSVPDPLQTLPENRSSRTRESTGRRRNWRSHRPLRRTPSSGLGRTGSRALQADVLVVYVAVLFHLLNPSPARY
jgi:hypothetical protein